MADHVHWNQGGWYFWDESQTTEYGPYETETLARIKAEEYGRYLDNGEVNGG